MDENLTQSNVEASWRSRLCCPLTPEEIDLNTLLLQALRGESLERPPIWIMRQAGRYLAPYRAIREKHGFQTMCKTADLAVEVTLQPIDILGVDAAILFSDIMIPAEPMGFDITFNPGPVVANPIRERADVEKLSVHEPEETLPYVYEAVSTLARELTGRVPLIGFGASPFTLAAYLVEGAGSKHFSHLKGMLYSDPATLHALLEKITAVTEKYLLAQAAAGASAVQLFDSWAGLLSIDEFREFSLPYAKRIVESLRAADVPTIYFALNGAHLLDGSREIGANAIGCDWRLPLDDVDRRLGGASILQGNLDPRVLLSDPATIRKHAKRVLKQASGLRGHVFNLGHGIQPTTPVEHARELVRCVQNGGRED
jgi:uroporphyrinogen decarboxylase